MEAKYKNEIIDPGKRKQILREFLGRLKSQVDLDLDPYIAELSKREVCSVKLIQLANLLEVDAVELWNLKVDEEALVRRFVEGNLKVLPSKYQGCAYSSSSSLLSVLETLEKYNLKKYMLKKLQINEMFLKEHSPLSIIAVNDALNEVGRFLKPSDLDEVGQRNCAKFMASDFGKAVKEFSSSLQQVYEVFADNIHLVERNWSYRTKSSSRDAVVIETWQSELMDESSKGEGYTNYFTSNCRFNFIKHIASNLGFEGVEVFQSSSLKDPTRFEFTVSLKNAIRKPFSPARELCQKALLYPSTEISSEGTLQ